MATKGLLAAYGILAAASFTAAAAEPPQTGGAPAGDANTRYCLRVGPVTGNLAETVQCWTRAEWLDQDVDIDKEWAKEGVSVIA